MKTVLVLLMFLLSWPMPYANAADGQYRLAENLRHENVLLPTAAPDRGSMTLGDYVMLWDGDLPFAIMVSYDDHRTKREIDYAEVYDLLGNLILITWTDRFGIFQIAMDRALLDEESGAAQGELVLITGGTPA